VNGYLLVRCYHNHATLIEAAQCAMPTGCGWYVIAVERGEARQASAETAKKNTDLMAQQIEQQKLLSRVVVRTGVDNALTTIMSWRPKTSDLINLNNLKAIPPTDTLSRPHTIVESAATIDLEAAVTLASALNDMELARAVTRARDM
jgi:hypothetical protein